MPRFVISIVNEDGSPVTTAFDCTADTEEQAKLLMAGRYGASDYASLLARTPFVGARERVVVTQEPEPIEVRGKHYCFIVHEFGKSNERLEMLDMDGEEELMNFETKSALPFPTEGLVKVIEQAYLAGRDDGERYGVAAAKAEIRRFLEIG